jgi:hypothetical protein
VALRDPFAAYNAASNTEAHLVCGLLNDAGIEATVIECASEIGGWVGGFIAEIHKPQVWIERADTDRAKPVLDEYERRAAERQKPPTGEPVEVTCEECGKRSTFLASQVGSVQNCPHCNAYVDVGDDLDFEGWDETPGEDESSTGL